MKTKSRMKTCVKCGSKHTTRHHVFPKVFYGDGPLVTLCPRHHRELEKKIQSQEQIVDGRRKQINRQYYLDCLVEYLIDK